MLQFSLNGEFIKEYKSIAEAIRETNKKNCSWMFETSAKINWLDLNGDIRMLPNHIQENLDRIKSTALVMDVETSAHWPDSGKEINIKTNFDDYVANARVKWVGAWSYKYNKYFEYNAFENPVEIVNLFQEHGVIIGFNSEEFDCPILVNNGFIEEKRRFLQVDCMQILGTSKQKNKQGYAFKNRAALMNYKLKRNSLKCVAETMKLDFQKGDIDYKIFAKDSWTEEETIEIKKYLKPDVMVPKQMFDRLWDYWLPFAELLDEKFIYDLSWIKNSIASLTYKAACKVMNVEPTYSDKTSSFEEMGGNVITPTHEELKGVWYVDFASLYPHIFAQFNLPAEIPFEEIGNGHKIWHGNSIFQVKGYYDISSWHPLSKYIYEKLKERIHLKKTDPKNPLVYTLKILLNGLYGVFRSMLFKEVHTQNCGWDCCWLGQQIQQFTIDMLDEFGFDTVYGDTDSCMIIARDEKNNNREYVTECLKQIVEIIQDNVPFPVDTFDINIEHYLEYIMWPFSDSEVVDEATRKKLKDGMIDGYTQIEEDKEKIIIETATNKVVKRGRSWVKERVGRKKNYLYIYKDKDELKTEIIGLPIKKDNATPLGLKIFNERLKPEILKNKQAKFTQKYIDNIIAEYLQKKEVIESLAIEYRVQKFDSYGSKSCIHAQISEGYFNGDEGVIRLIKNSKLGNAGKTSKYCTIKEAMDEKLTVDELDLEKVYNELGAFVLYEEALDKAK